MTLKKSRSRAQTPILHCTAVPLLVLAGGTGAGLLALQSFHRLTSTSSCRRPFFLDDSTGTDIGLVGGSNFLRLSLPYLILALPTRPRPLPW